MGLMTAHQPYCYSLLLQNNLYSAVSVLLFLLSRKLCESASLMHLRDLLSGIFLFPFTTLKEEILNG